MSPLVTGIGTGILASVLFTPIGGIVIGYLAYRIALKEECELKGGKR